MVWKFPLKMSNFSIFPFGSKNNYSGWVKKYPSQRRVGLLFSAGQKNAWVGLDQGPSLARRTLKIKEKFQRKEWL